MKQSFEIAIPSVDAQDSWTDLDAQSDELSVLRNEMDEFLDIEQANMSEIIRKFAGKKVRITVQTIR